MTVKVTIEFEYDPVRENYDRKYSKEYPLGLPRTSEEIEALTEQDMADEDKQGLVNGDYNIVEVMEWSQFVWDKEHLEKHVTFKVI